LDETDRLLREFYEPYNYLLAKAYDNEGFMWTPDPEQSLRQKLILSEANKQKLVLPPRANKLSAQSGILPLSKNSPPAQSPKKQDTTTLRGAQKFIKLTPRSFDISDLEGSDTDSSMIASWLQESGVIRPGLVPHSDDEAGDMLAHAVMALDLPALKYLLYNIGVPPNAVSRRDRDRNAFDVLATLGVIGEGHEKSVVYSLLKGQPSWVHDYFDPPLPVKQPSVHSIDIMAALDKRIRAVIAWLDRAGVSVHNIHEYRGNLLHFAVNGGVTPLVEYALKKGVDPNFVNYQKRSPVHIAAALGRTELLKTLIDAGGDIKKKDMNGVSAYDIISGPGPVQADDAIHILGIQQRPARKIDRYLHPEINSNNEHIDPADFDAPKPASSSDHPFKGWPTTGGWGIERQPGFESDMECGFDQYYADEITPEEVFHKYLARNSPVLIRGLIHSWPAIEKWSKDALKAKFGDMVVQVSDIPYAEKYGGKDMVDMPLGEYIDQVSEHNIVGGHNPWCRIVNCVCLYLRHLAYFPGMCLSTTPLSSCTRATIHWCTTKRCLLLPIFRTPSRLLSILATTTDLSL
jgi:hypothetical protein